MYSNDLIILAPRTNLRLSYHWPKVQWLYDMQVFVCDGNHPNPNLGIFYNNIL